jgi:hypothetical protein
LYYLSDLLDRLEEYFKVLKTFKKNDPDSYNLYKKTGAQITNKDTFFQCMTIHPYFKEKRPSFYMLHFNEDEKESLDKKLSPRLLYFRKVKWNPDIQLTPYDIYRICLYFKDKTTDYGVVSFYLAVDKENQIHLLHEKKTSYKTIYSKHGKPRDKIYIPITQWEISDVLKQGLKERREDAKNGKDEKFWETATEKDYALNLFSILLNSAFNSYDGFQIHVIDNLGHVANFNINMLRTPYFFKDREKTVTINGKTKKIFHIVRTHKRKLLNKEVYIKTHFRGLRKFTWNNYKVIIQNPKKELNLRNFESAASEIEKEQFPIPGFVDTEQMGKEFFERIVNN